MAYFPCHTTSHDFLENKSLKISALQSYWKYPIGYVLIDKINADDLYRLITRALQLPLDNNLKVRTVTCEATATNFKSMKLLGCKLGENLNEIDGTFTFPGYSYDIFLRVVNDWNKLPPYIVEAKSLSIFKTELDKYWEDAMFMTSF